MFDSHAKTAIWQGIIFQSKQKTRVRGEKNPNRKLAKEELASYRQILRIFTYNTDAIIIEVTRNIPRTGNFPAGKGCFAERIVASTAALRFPFSFF